MKKRLPWLIILLFLGMGVSSVVGVFETVVAVLPVVMCFQSLILDMAGNVNPVISCNDPCINGRDIKHKTETWSCSKRNENRFMQWPFPWRFSICIYRILYLAAQA